MYNVMSDGMKSVVLGVDHSLSNRPIEGQKTLYSAVG